MADEQPKCPVDHATREIWVQKGLGHPKIEETLGHSKHTPAASTPDACPIDHSKHTPAVSAPDACPVNHTKHTPAISTPDACPVDHNSRESWLRNVQVTAVVPEAIEKPGCTSDALDSTQTTTSKVDLPVEREISSIPRTSHKANWIYPSQKQFFDAMERKNWSPEKQDMQTVVPIHNAVNERVWGQILTWEKTNYAKAVEQCGGISLTSFKGDSKKLTPRAWFRSTLLGYQKPFDRHDWVVDRCGVKVEYVIDFYAGNDAKAGASFFLDVRPKLNHWQGIKLRIGKAFGFV